jgi:hypothetical protein
VVLGGRRIHDRGKAGHGREVDLILGAGWAWIEIGCPDAWHLGHPQADQAPCSWARADLDQI